MRSVAKLATTLQANLPDALLFRTLATLAIEGPEVGVVDDWQWRAPRPGAEAWAHYLDLPNLVTRTRRLAGARA